MDGMSRQDAWLAADFVHPTKVRLGSGLHLRPIRAADADIDYPAVMGSRQRLWKMYGEDWGWPPESMSLEQDRDDLARHEAEISRHESFNYALLDAAESALLGCVYIDPPEVPDTDAEISWWVIDSLIGSQAEAELDSFVPRWIEQSWPFERPSYRRMAFRRSTPD